MECLTNYIGIRHCSQEEPESGLYINNLPGMSTELVDKIANSEQITFLGVWEDVQKRAIGRFVQDFQMYLFDIAKTGFNKTIYHTQKLTKPRNYEVLNEISEYRGIYVYLPISRFVKFDLSSIQIYVHEVPVSPIVTVKIFDLQNEVLLDSKEITLVKGVNNIEFLTEFSINTNAIELFIGIEGSFKTVETLDELYGWYDQECAYYPTWQGLGYDTQAVLIPARMGMGETPTYASVGFPGVGQGISIDAQVTCSIEQFLCENRKHLKTAFLYLLGSEMLFQKISSNIGSRVNYFTNGNLEQTQNTRDLFEKEYVKAMKNAVRSLNISDSGVCFACNENAQSFTGSAMP